jgi:predicted RNase H-like nuclease (RuvC/YqgF family)
MRRIKRLEERLDHLTTTVEALQKTFDWVKAAEAAQASHDRDVRALSRDLTALVKVVREHDVQLAQRETPMPETPKRVPARKVSKKPAPKA